LKIAIYARVSTAQQTVEQQIDKLRLKVKRHNEIEEEEQWYIVKEYLEKESAFKQDHKRKQFNQMLEDAKNGKFNILLVWSFDRFSRGGVFKTIPLLERLHSYGVQFKSVQESFLDSTSPNFELMMPIFSWIAKQESKHRSERMKIKFDLKRKKNEPIGRATQSALMKEQGIPDKILELKKENPSLSIRNISKMVKYKSKDGKLRPVSLGYVHLTLKKGKA